MTGLAALAAAWLGSALFLGLGGCDGGGGGGAGGGAGAGGAGGCPSHPEAMFTLTVRAADGPVPPDTTLEVSWSAANEPPFVLDDKSTWGTLDDSNVICAVDRALSPPLSLPELVCELWTGGVAQVRITAAGYEMVEQTLMAVMSEECEGFLPQSVDIELVPERDGEDDR